MAKELPVADSISDHVRPGHYHGTKSALSKPQWFRASDETNYSKRTRIMQTEGGYHVRFRHSFFIADSVYQFAQDPKC